MVGKLALAKGTVRLKTALNLLYVVLYFSFLSAFKTPWQYITSLLKLVHNLSFLLVAWRKEKWNMVSSLPI